MVGAIIAVLVFLAVLFAIGVYTKKFVTNSSDFLLAGREMGFGLNMMGFVASGFAGTTTYNADFYTQGLGGATLPGMSLVYPSVLTMVFALGINLVWGGQHYWIRGASCRNEKTAKNVFIVGAAILLAIHVLIGMVGFYAGANFGEEFTLAGGEALPTMAYGMTIAKLPYAMGVFLLVFALAAALSTCSTTLIAAVSISVKDIYPKFINKNPNERQLTRVSRIATVVVSLLAWGLAYYPGGATFLFAFATAWMAPAGYLLVLGIIWRRCTPTAAFVGAVCAIVVESAWAVMDLLKIPLAGAPVGSYIHISALGMICTLVPTILVSFFTKPKYYGEPGWTLREKAMGGKS